MAATRRCRCGWRRRRQVARCWCPGLTVVVAMSGMFLSGMLLFDGFAVAAILVVLVAVLGSVTVLPALLSVLGDRVDLGPACPDSQRMRRPQRGQQGVGRHPRPGSRPAGRVGRGCPGVPVAACFARGRNPHREAQPGQAAAGEQRASCRRTTASRGVPRRSRLPPSSWSRRPTCRAATCRQPSRAFTSRALATGLVHQPIQVTVHGRQRVLEIAVPLAGNGSGRDVRPSAGRAAAGHRARRHSVSCRARGRTSRATSRSPRTSTPSWSGRSFR